MRQTHELKKFIFVLLKDNKSLKLLHAGKVIGFLGILHLS